MSKTEPKTNDQFAEVIAGHLHDILRAAGITMSPLDSHEKIRAVAKRLALSIEHQANQEAIRVFRALQGAVDAAFDKMEADFTDQKSRIGHLEEVVSLQTKLLENMSKALDALADPGSRVVLNDKVIKEPHLETLEIRPKQEPPKVEVDKAVKAAAKGAVEAAFEKAKNEDAS